MKRVESLTGKNLPRLAVAKPGWPGNARQGELLEKPKRRMRGQLMQVCDAGDGGEGRSVNVQMRCEQCDYQSGWLHFDTVTEAKRGLPCPKCNAEPSTITPQAVRDFTRVCDQTGLSEKLRKD